MHPAILEASGLLSRTLLPHINALTNFSFITEESHFIFGRFLSSMILHHQDTQLPIGTGLMLLGLELNPMKLKGMCLNPMNLVSLKEALSHFGIASTISTIIATSPDKFLFPGLLIDLRRKPLETASVLVSIISKADILSAPG